MPVKLKFDAYPFQDYGVVNLTRLWKQRKAKAETFELEIALIRLTFKTKTNVALTPGQTATEVIVAALLTSS